MVGNPSKLKPCTPENARERQLKGAAKRKENHAKKVLMSQIYADFLRKKYNIDAGDGVKQMTGSELVNECMKKIIETGGSPAVSLLKELREATEGQKINLTGNVKTEMQMQTTEERIKLFDEIVGEK